MDYFTEIPDAAAITICNGVYRQVKLYARGGRVYARHGSGYVRVLPHGTTSAPGVRCVEYDDGGSTMNEKGGQVMVTKLRVVAAE